MDQRAAITTSATRDGVVLVASGNWTVNEAQGLDDEIRQVAAVPAGTRVTIDLEQVDLLDTAGAWLLHRTARDLVKEGHEVVYTGLDPSRETLFTEVEKSDHPPAEPRHDPPFLTAVITDTGEGVIESGRDLIRLSTLFGQVIFIVIGYLARPWRIRLTSITYHLEYMGLRAVPIIALISFLIGGIVEQQGAYQLRYFGAEILSIDLAGILVLRELGVLLTSIMIAGRSGSAITAELGSMKMREEVDALRTLALDPIEVLVVPRMIALLIALPLLTFISNMSALAGAGLTAWAYIDIAPSAFIPYLREAVDVNTFFVGLIKAPFMAVVIGMIACLEGLQVEGSAESLGRRTTASVVKAIFLVMVLDGIFAMFFAAIDF